MSMLTTFKLFETRQTSRTRMYYYQEMSFVLNYTTLRKESPAEEKTAELITAIWPKHRSYFFRSF